MSDVRFTCQYCDHSWKPYVNQYGWAPDKGDKCPKCGDKNIEKRRIEKIDYYADPGVTGKRTSKT